MKTKLLEETDKALLQYNPETDALELIWKQMHDEETYRTMFLKGLDYIIKFGASCWLSDIRNEGVVSPKNSEWLQKEMIPKAVEYGLKKAAVVLGKDAFRMYYVNNVRKATDLLHVFDSVEAANEWFME